MFVGQSFEWIKERRETGMVRRGEKKGEKCEEYKAK